MKYFNTKYIVLFTLLVLLFSTSSCEKFLDEKPVKALVLPETLEDYGLILEEGNLIDAGYLAETSADDYYYLTAALFQAQTLTARNSYIWKPDIFEGTPDNYSEWTTGYRGIYYANCVIEGLEKLENKSSAKYKQLLGWAHFIRGSAYHRLAGVFAPQYHPTTDSRYGLPLKVKASVTEKISRASVHDTYALILSDLQYASTLLPVEAQLTKNRPNKAAALGMLARVYLSMNKFTEALDASTKSIESYGVLLDYNGLPTTGNFPFVRNNVENLSYMRYNNVRAITTSPSNPARIVQSLYDSYDANDLRKVLYFQLISGLPAKKGSYTGSTQSFAGLATDEVYLMKAECLARAGSYNESMAELNKMLVTRYRTGTFVPLAAATKEQALAIILQERRKELILRGLRWMDLRRLNAEGANITLTRVIDGITYTLPPNSPLYTLPIPTDEIQYSGIEQNPR